MSIFLKITFTVFEFELKFVDKVFTYF